MESSIKFVRGIVWSMGLLMIGLVFPVGTPVAAKDATKNAYDVPYSVPAGITLVEVIKERPRYRPAYLWTRLGDANGNSLYIPNVHSGVKCTAECAASFEPMLSAKAIASFGDWSTKKLPDGTSQWVYQGNPIFRMTPAAAEKLKEQASKGAATGLYGFDESNEEYAPEGWQLAKYQPQLKRWMPPGVAIQPIPAARGQGLVVGGVLGEGGAVLFVDTSAGRKRPICDGDGCDLDWHPLAAPALAVASGDFKAVAQKDGLLQWYYKGFPLFYYKGNDASISDGFSVPKGFEALQLALVERDFVPEDVSVAYTAGAGGMLATTKGQPLYSLYALEMRWGARNSYRGFLYNRYDAGKSLGPSRCADACLNEWRPLEAGKDAVARGYWEPIDRAGGSRQWAYKGYVLYTNPLDKGLLGVEGTNKYTYLIYDDAEEAVTETASAPVTNVNYGLYWHVTKP